MHRVWAIGVFFTTVFMGGALLAPWLYKSVQALATVFPQIKSLAAAPLDRYVNRAFLVAGVAACWPLARALGMRTWQQLGLTRTPHAARNWALGFCVGFVSLASVAAMTLMAGASVPDPDLTFSSIAGHAGKAGLTALVVSVIEEIFFRGVLFGGLRTALAWPLALLMSSVLYALLHFFQRGRAPEVVEWSSGLYVLGQMCGNLTHFEKLVPGFFTLTLAGLILGLAYQRTGALYLSIGMHAGWIFWLKSSGFLTQQKGSSWFWGSAKLIDGWLAFGVLSIVFVFLLRTERVMRCNEIEPAANKADSNP